MRMHGHGAHDDMSYVPKELYERWAARDPIDLYSRRLVETHGFDAEDGSSGSSAEVKAEVDAAAKVALDSPMPDPELATDGRLRRRRPAPRRRRGPVVALAPGQRKRAGQPHEPGVSQAEHSRRPAPKPDAVAEDSGGGVLTYLEAISDGLREEMRRDETVFCLGEDIGAFGGAFKVTDGFVEEFGADRVVDTPLAENAIIGAAVGAAVEGLRPVCEMQFADFIACGFDQLVNVAAKLHYRQGIAVPMVVRLPSGGGFSGGPFHSQNPEAWFLQTPGLKVVAPAFADDAKGLLASAIRDPNPVCFLEHKGLYRHVKGEVPGGEHAVPLGKARVARAGGEMTVIAYGSSVHLALERRRGARRGHRGARPPLALPARHRGDPGAAPARPARSSSPTRRRARAASEPRSPRWSPSEAFEDLDAPVRRLTAPDVPIPFSPPLEQAVLPAARRHEGGLP